LCTTVPYLDYDEDDVLDVLDVVQEDEEDVEDDMDDENAPVWPSWAEGVLSGLRNVEAHTIADARLTRSLKGCPRH